MFRGCKNFSRLIDEYTDGRLGGPELLRFESHARACPKCFRSLQEWGKMVAMIKSIDRVRAPEGFEQRLGLLLKSEAIERKPNFVSPLAPLGVGVSATAIAALIVGAFMVHHFRAEKPERAYQDSRKLAQQAVEGQEQKSPPQQPLQAPDIGDRSEYVEVLLKDSGNRDVIMRLPRTIRIRPSPHSEEIYLTSVSH